MNFPIEIRHMATGLAKVFHSIEDLAAHLRDNVKEEWEGWTHLRLHPAMAALDEPVAVAPAPAEPPAPAPTAAPAEPAAASTSEAPSESHADEPAAAPAAVPADAPAEAVGHDPAQDTTGS